MLRLLKGLDFGVEVAAVPVMGVGFGDAGHYVAGEAVAEGDEFGAYSSEG